MRKVRIEDTFFYMLNWADIDRDMEKLSDLITEGFGMPTLIVGILRGGVTVANLLSDCLGMKNVRGIGTRSYNGVDNRGDSDLYQPLPTANLRRHDVVLVDDVSDTGKTFKEISESQIKAKNPRKVCTASLYVKKWTSFFPNFYVKAFDGWIVFPWEMRETMRTVTKTLIQKHNYDPEKARSTVAKKFGCKLKYVKKITGVL